ncbi:MAG: VWA domain-containing protein [Hyphomicrobiaceae bacterium]|nr:VWA domain-containing protein [Hyphomicrobiaceae bacterium]
MTTKRTDQKPTEQKPAVAPDPFALATGSAPSAPGPSAPPAAKGASAPPAAKRSSDAEVADFLAKLSTIAPQTHPGSGRLIFGLDATMSRQPTWDMALALQGDMFEAVRETGGLDVQLVYFRGFGECRATKWVSEPRVLRDLMTRITVQGGRTQIGRVLAHARSEAAAGRVNALVYVGDAVEEPVDTLCALAGELGLVGVPGFFFQEGRDVAVEAAFKEMARLSKGAWCPFDAGSAAQLRDLLRAVAVYASGGTAALERLAAPGPGGAGARRLIEQLRR